MADEELPEEKEEITPEETDVTPEASIEEAQPEPAPVKEEAPKTEDAAPAKDAEPVAEATGVKYAGFWIRFLAYLIDGFILAIPIMIIQFVFLMGTTGITYGLGDSSAGAAAGLGLTLISSLASMLIYVAYFALMESSKNQATLGKMALGLKVTDLEGNRLTLGRAVGRNLARYLSMFILYIGYFMIGFTEKKQGLHDMIAKTYVVKK